MMSDIIFATRNEHKVKEIQGILKGPNELQFISLNDVGITVDIPETSDTIEGNALQKAQYVYDRKKMAVMAEDTGLEVFALNMEPGVHTARYAGNSKDPNLNMEKLLVNLKDKNDRSARFKTIISFIDEKGKTNQFEGIANGKIAFEPKGNLGFGYDPIFIPDGFDLTFAELGDDIKNKISHRAKATELFKQFLDKLR